MEESVGLLLLNNRIYTSDSEGTGSIYGESLMEKDGRTYREWVPWRSKLAALLKKETLPFDLRGDVLYLGAAQGTTVSHLSDILRDGSVFAVEFSTTAFRNLLSLSRKRRNIVPILADAFHPELYASQVPDVFILYQDVSQKDQLGMFLRNSRRFLGKGGYGVVMVKSRSIDVTARPEDVFLNFEAGLRRSGFDVLINTELSPFQKDHAALVVRKG
ncbi:MAG: fibrillarin-like rRNA/tRNA 2'-O-methyltransferase [Thermoplasmatota archaeon]